jgi:hypothetical protein
MPSACERSRRAISSNSFLRDIAEPLDPPLPTLIPSNAVPKVSVPLSYALKNDNQGSARDHRFLPALSSSAGGYPRFLSARSRVTAPRGGARRRPAAIGRPPWPCPRSNLSLPHPCRRVRPHTNLDQQSGWCLLSSRHPRQAHNLRPRRSLALSNRGLKRPAQPCARRTERRQPFQQTPRTVRIILNRPRRAPRATAAIFRPAQALTARSAQPTAPISRSTVARTVLRKISRAADGAGATEPPQVERKYGAALLGPLDRGT